MSDASRLCAECGASLGASLRCPSCGASRAAPVTSSSPTGPEVDVSWAQARAATWAFLVAQVVLRGLVAVEGGGVARHVTAAAVSVGVVLGVLRALGRRNVAVLTVWSWMTALAATMLVGGGVVWALVASPRPSQLALVGLGAIATAGVAWTLRRARRVIEG